MLTTLGLWVPALDANPAAQRINLAPSSKWVVDYAEDSCELRRAFQAGKDQAILQITDYGLADSLTVAVVSDTIGTTKSSPRVQFEPDQDFEQPHGFFFLEKGKTHGVLFNDDLRPAATKQPSGPAPDWTNSERDARESSITGLLVTGSFDHDLFLLTGSLHAPMEAVRSCIDDLVKHWGLDPAEQRALSRRPKPLHRNDWVRKVEEAYPPDMLGKGQSGIAHVRLMIGTDGKPTACVPHQQLVDQSFEQTACTSLMRYARFEPALDANGVPVASVYVTTVTYQIVG